MVSIIVFLPSIMLSGIMFPIELLPETFETIGRLLPATWGYQLIVHPAFGYENLLALILTFLLALGVCVLLLRKADQ